MTKIRLSAIAFDAGTQIRAAIDQHVVSDYAEAMTAGAVFPPIVLFHDGTQHYLADGFHRFLAAQRNKWRELDADVRPGTRADALWFGLGANKKNGIRLSDVDKRHAVLLAARTFLQHKSQQQIADQIGCTQGFVSLIISRNNVARPERVEGLDGQTYPATKDARLHIRERAAKLLAEGKSVAEVTAAVGIGKGSAYELQRELKKLDKSKAGVRRRRERMKEMAGAGHTSRQIAAELGLSEEGCRGTMRELGIDVPADRAVGRIHRHDGNRILERIVMDAENLTEAVNLIDFAAVDFERVGEWVDSLMQSRKSLDAFIKRLVKEREKHGEAA